MDSFTGKLAVVTGGGSGMGRMLGRGGGRRSAGGRGAGYVIRNVSSPSGGSACTATWSTTA
jgi:hypothetical protein